MMNGPHDFVGPVNLGNPGEFTMRELAEHIIDLTESTSRIIFEAASPDDPARRRPDIGLAAQILGWQPSIDLDEGLKRTIAYFRSL